MFSFLDSGGIGTPLLALHGHWMGASGFNFDDHGPERLWFNDISWQGEASETQETDDMYFAEFGTIALVVLLACVSPGPDFIAVTSSALSDRTRGMMVALGVATACGIWAALAILGLGMVMSHLSWFYDVLRIIGAAYLVWLGAKMLISAFKSQSMPDLSVTTKLKDRRSAQDFWST